MPRRLVSIVIAVVLLVASIALVHLAFFWFGSWFHPAGAWQLWTIIFGILLFGIVYLWYWADPQRAGILAAAIAIGLIELSAVIFARGWDFTRLTYTQGFNAEMAMVFLPVAAYALTRFTVSRRRRRSAPPGMAKASGSHSASPARDEHRADSPPR